MRQFDATILINREISPSWKALGLAWPKEAGRPRPGQFFTFRPKALEPGDAGLLRRPLAFAAFSGEAAFALYQVRGSGTRALAAACEGSALDIIGPLGKEFPLPLDDEKPCLLGGGIGIGPLLFLHAALSAMNRPFGASPSLLLGFRSKTFIPDFSAALEASPVLDSDGRAGLETLLESLSLAKIATDDGSRGYAGTVMDALGAEPAAGIGSGAPRPHYYACGPGPMLAALDALARAEGVAAHLSVEQWMACGVGACHGCVLPSAKGGYLRACADGPVFAAGAIRWKE